MTPHSAEIERAVIGAILLDNTAYFDAGSELNAADFFLDSHRLIFRATAAMMEEGRPVDMVTLWEELKARKESETVGGMAYLCTLTEGVTLHRETLIHYTQSLKEKAMRRSLIKACSKAIEQAEDTSLGLAEVTSNVNAEIMGVAASAAKEKPAPAAQGVRELMHHLEALRKVDMNERAILGFRTGLPTVDKKTTGLRRGEYYLLGGITKDGKTSMAVQCITCAVSDGTPVLFFSHEMTRKAVFMRMACLATSISHEHLRDPRKMGMFEWTELEAEAQRMSKLPLWIQDSGTMDIASLRAQTRLFVRQHGVKMIVVDFIQKVRAPGKSNYEVVTNVSEGLRELAKSENVAVLALSQFSVPADKKKRRPTLFDFKQSGDLASDAHAAFAVYRPVDDTGNWTGKDEFWILAQRSGPGHVMVPVAYNDDRLIFEERP